jgi:Zn-dependent protease with chaperone function
MRATYYDGKYAVPREVDLRIEGHAVVVSGEGVEYCEPLAAVEITDAIGSTLRLLRFMNGASCEVAENDAFATMLAEHGMAPSRISSWEKGWQPTVAALGVIAVVMALGYQYALPAMARSAADRLSPSALDSLSVQTQRVLDHTVFSQTKIHGRRLASLLNMFDALKLPERLRGQLRLEFRRAPSLGPNAMALPSGVIFVTDDLVDIIPDDRVVMAVIAHEAGHVDKRHGLRQIIQSSIVGVLVTWYIGDAGALGAAAPTALLQAKYSRDLEREADVFATQVLTMNGLPASLLAEALEQLEKSHGDDPGNGAVALSYLSSHPATAERLAWIRSRHLDERVRLRK